MYHLVTLVNREDPNKRDRRMSQNVVLRFGSPVLQMDNSDLKV